MAFLADQQSLRFEHVARQPELIDFFDERSRIHYDAATDYTAGTGLQRTRGDQMQHGLDTVYNESVAGVVAALETSDDVGFRRQYVDDLAFAFVAPLQPDNDDAFGPPSHDLVETHHVGAGDIGQLAQLFELISVEG